MFKANPFSQSNGWFNESGSSYDVVMSSRIRLARNLHHHTFPEFMKFDEERGVRDKIISIFNTLPVLKKFTIIYLKELNPIEKRILFERNFITQDFILSNEKAVAINEDGHIFIMINGEDHIRLTCFKGGLSLTQAYEEIDSIETLLDDQLQFAFSTEWGYLNSSLINIGTGMRVSLMLHLPALVMTSLISKAFKAVTQVGLAVKGFFNEGVTSLGHIYQISNQITLGQSEKELLHNIVNILVPLVEEEKKARVQLLKKKQVELEDKIFRAYGILSNCRIITVREAVEKLSLLRLGICLNLVDNLSLETVTALFVLSQKAHVQMFMSVLEKKEDIVKIDYMRAKIIRNSILNNCIWGVE